MAKKPLKKGKKLKTTKTMMAPHKCA